MCIRVWLCFSGQEEPPGLPSSTISKAAGTCARTQKQISRRSSGHLQSWLLISCVFGTEEDCYCSFCYWRSQSICGHERRREKQPDKVCRVSESLQTGKIQVFSLLSDLVLNKISLESLLWKLVGTKAKLAGERNFQKNC